MRQSEKSKPIMKRWKDVKNKEINLQKKNYCLYCKYSSTMGSSGSKGNVNEFNGVICDYIGKTGKRRGCSPIGCIKFEEIAESSKKRNKKIAL